MPYAVQVRGMKPQRKTSEEMGATQQPGERGIEARNSLAVSETAITPANTDYSAQQLGTGHGRIMVGHCVAASDEGNPILTWLLGHESVNEASLVAQNQYDVPGNHLVSRRSLQRQQIARP